MEDLISVVILKRQDYFTTYFYPWEFTDFGGFQVPWYITKNSGEKLVRRLDWLIQELKTNGNEFITYCDYIKDWQNANKETD